jgi:hypothetical protein
MSRGFTNSNRYFAGLGFNVWSWNLPSGYSCPGAKECLAHADRTTGKITNGRHQKFRCYSATGERYPAVRDKAWANYEAMKGKTPAQAAGALLECFPAAATHVRIHAGGDFFSQNYFDGWLMVCVSYPEVKFWAFTKSLPFWIARMGGIPTNLCLQASYGGKHDALIKERALKYALVVYSVEEAALLGLRIDTDDGLAIEGDESFALLEKTSARKAKWK